MSSDSVSGLPEGFLSLNGLHAYRTEGALLIVLSRGKTTVPDLMALRQLHGDIKKKYGYVLAIYDGKDATGLEPDARKWAAEHSSGEMMFTAAAMYNTPFAIRVIATLTYKAVQLLTKLQLGPMEFFATEAEARAFVEQFRPALSP